MNTPQKPFLLLFCLTSLFISAQAQHNGEGRGQRSNSYSSRGGGNYSRPNNDFGQRASNRSYDYNRQSNGAYDRRVADNRIYEPNMTRQSNSVSRRNDIPSVYNDRSVTRNAVLGNQRGYNSVPQNSNRTVIVNNNYRMTSINSYPAYSRYPTVYSYNHGAYSFVGYNYYVPRSYVYVGAPRYTVVPRTFVSISFGGYPYWYDGGYFYGYYGGFYQPVFAPIGIHVSILPFGYFPFYMGPNMFYYFNGTYYKKAQDRDEYEVVDAPMGAVVKSLPKGATKVVLNGEKFYEFDGTYYKEGTNNKNEVVYTVVGKNGVINNSEQQPQHQAAATTHAPQVGDEITALPDNSKQVTINGDVLYVTPDNLYLKAQTVDNNTTYKVVGRAE